MTKNAVDTEIVDRHAPTEFCRWIVSDFTMCLLTMVSTGTSFHLAASHSLMVLLSVSAGKDVWTTRDIAAAAHHAFVCLCKTRLRTLWNTFNHGKLVRSNVLEETSHLPGRQAFPLSQVPHSDLPICRSRAEGGERVGVLGDAGQPVPVPVQAAEERFGKHTLQLYCIQCTLVFSLRRERVFHRTEDIILYICKRWIWETGLPLISVDLVDVVLGLPDVIFRISFQHLDLHGEDPLLTLHDSEMDNKSEVYANARNMMWTKCGPCNQFDVHLRVVRGDINIGIRS